MMEAQTSGGSTNGYIMIDEEISVRDVSMSEEFCLRLSPSPERIPDDDDDESFTKIQSGSDFLGDLTDHDVTVSDESLCSLENDLISGDNQINWFHSYARSANNPDNLLEPSTSSSSKKQILQLEGNSLAEGSPSKSDEVTNSNLLRSFRKYSKSPKKDSPTSSPQKATISSLNHSSTTVHTPPPVSSLRPSENGASDQMERTVSASDRNVVPSPSEGEIAPHSTGGDIFLSGVLSKIQKKIIEEHNTLSSPSSSSSSSSWSLSASEAQKLSLSALKDNIRQKISNPSSPSNTLSSPTKDSMRLNVSVKQERCDSGDDGLSELSSSENKKKPPRRNELAMLYDALREIKWVQKMNLKNLMGKSPLRRHSLRHKDSQQENLHKKKPAKSKMFQNARILKAKARVAEQNGKKYRVISKTTTIKKPVSNKNIKASVMKKKGTLSQNLISEENIKKEPKEQGQVCNARENLVPVVPLIKQEVIQKVQNGLLQSVSPTSHGMTTHHHHHVQFKEQNQYLSLVLKEIQSSRTDSEDEGSRPQKKRKIEEDSVRSSIRQSECAFRYKEIVVKKHQNYIHIVLLPNENKLNALTLQMLRELKEAVASAQKDASCRVLLLSSSGKYFCSGIDLTGLVGPDKQQNVGQFASAIRSLVETLSTFPKPVVAAVNGIAVGLGVILLTYCDVVFASDKATFCTPYCHYGYIPEGAGTVTLPQVVGATIASDMLLRGRKLTALEAHTYGLVSEVFWPTKVMEEVIPRVQAMAEQSARAMEVTKAMLRCHLWEKVKATLENEVHILPKQWLSQSCQESMKAESESRKNH